MSLPPLDRDTAATALQRLRAAASEHPDALGLADSEPFLTAIQEALLALDGRPHRIRGILTVVLDAIGGQLTGSYGVTVSAAEIAEIYGAHPLLGEVIAWGASDTGVRERLAGPLSRALGGPAEWPFGDPARLAELRAAAERRGWEVDPDRFG